MDWISFVSVMIPMVALSVLFLLVVGILWRIFKKLK